MQFKWTACHLWQEVFQKYWVSSRNMTGWVQKREDELSIISIHSCMWGYNLTESGIERYRGRTEEDPTLSHGTPAEDPLHVTWYDVPSREAANLCHAVPCFQGSWGQKSLVEGGWQVKDDEDNTSKFACWKQKEVLIALYFLVFFSPYCVWKTLIYPQSGIWLFQLLQALFPTNFTQLFPQNYSISSKHEQWKETLEKQHLL